MASLPPDADFVLMGVSLSNKTFTRSRVGAIFDWCDRQPAMELLIWLGDDLEAINFEVFKGMAPAGALSRARARGAELQAMFMKAYREKPTRQCRLAGVLSQQEIEGDPAYEGTIRETSRLLERLFEGNKAFRDTVLRQVTTNFEAGDKETDRLDDAKLIRLADYILGELAVFLGIYKARGRLTEIYPGPNLFVKEELLAGVYGVGDFLDGAGAYHYVNIAAIGAGPEVS